MEEWDYRCQGCRAPIPNDAHLLWHPALLSHTQHRPTGKEAGTAAVQAEMLVLLMVPSKTPDRCKPRFPWELGEVQDPHHPLTETHSRVSQTVLAHELYDGGQAGGTIPTLCLALMLAAGVPRLGLPAAQGHTASSHLRSPTFRAGSLPLTQLLD